MTRRKSDKDDSISLIVEKAALEEYYGSLDTNAGSAMIETINGQAKDKEDPKREKSLNVFSDGVTQIVPLYMPLKFHS
ncbi:UNVERIFIED_CONTAM: hypothetical protein FKN15_022285 [Acipenser sinensis]